MPATPVLDAAEVERAAPPGSMRYFAMLYAPKDRREALAALYVIDAQIRATAHSINHDVAHSRLRWWRQEIDRLANGAPQHPATRKAHAHNLVENHHFAVLHELLVAADMDLVRMTYQNTLQLNAYCSRSGGALHEAIARQLLAPAPLEPAIAAAVNKIGAAIRKTEILRDVSGDACQGRLYLPADLLEPSSIKLEDLRAKPLGTAIRAALGSFRAATSLDLEQAMAAISGSARAYLRPIVVSAALHRELLQRMAALDHNVAGERIELGPLRKSWIAWRAASQG